MKLYFSVYWRQTFEKKYFQCAANIFIYRGWGGGVFQKFVLSGGYFYEFFGRSIFQIFYKLLQCFSKNEKHGFGCCENVLTFLYLAIFYSTLDDQKIMLCCFYFFILKQTTRSFLQNQFLFFGRPYVGLPTSTFPKSKIPSSKLT